MSPMTTHPWPKTFIPSVLGLAALMLLIFHVPAPAMITAELLSLLIYGLLTALAVFFAVILSDSEISLAHAIGMLAFLALPEPASDAALWAVALGSALGGAALMLRSRGDAGWRRFIFTIARQTISFYVAGQVYLLLGGTLPLKRDTWDFDLLAGLTLGIYALTYIVVYLALYLAEYYPVKRVNSSDVPALALVLVLPLPFAVLGAVVANQLTAPLEIISLIGLALIIGGLYSLSRSEYRLRRQLDELRTLSVVTRATRAHLNLETLLKTIYLQVSHLLETDDFVVALFNPERNRMEYPLVIRRGQEETGLERDAHPSVIHDSLIEHVLKTQAPLLIRKEVAETVRQLGLAPLREPLTSWLGVPLLAGGNALGVMAVRSEDPHRHFTQDNLRLLNIVAASASIAIENAQLYRQQTERAEQLTTLNNIAQLLSGTLSPDSVLDTIITSASILSQADAVAVYIYVDATSREENEPYLRFAGLESAIEDKPMMLRTTMPPLHVRMPLTVSDVTTDRRLSDIRAKLLRQQMNAFVELPLARGENDLGVIVLYFRSVQFFSGERIELLRTFATQAAQAIVNARTYAVTDEAFQRSVEQLISLAAIGRVLTSSIDLVTICEQVLHHALNAIRLEIGAVVLTDADSTQYRVMAQRGYPDKAFDDPAAIRRGLGWGLLDGDDKDLSRVRVIDDVSKLRNYLRLVETTRSQVIAPITRGSELYGFITLESEKSGGFSAEDSHFLAQLTNQAVIAIENARLFQRITEARDRFQVILDAMDEAIILVDLRGRIILANPRITLLGLQPAALINQSLTDLLRQPGLKIVERLGFVSVQELLALVDDMASPEDWSSYPAVMYTLHQETGELYLQRFIIPVQDEQKKVMGALLVFYNKTEEQELSRARQELSRMIVHDLRSPLTAVTTSLKLIRDYVPGESEFRPMVESVTDTSRRAIRKLLARVDSLLDISRMESGRLSIDPEVTELAPLAATVRAELGPLAHELEISIVPRLDPALPLLHIDPDKVERLLLNLVDNALKYSPANSEVSIRAFPPGAQGAPPDFVRVEVVDRGPGVPDDYKTTLFDRFVQVEGRRKVRRGVGLGLTFCKLVTEAHGGQIWIEDNPAGGSIFALTLPIAHLNRLPSDEDALPADRPDGC